MWDRWYILGAVGGRLGHHGMEPLPRADDLERGVILSEAAVILREAAVILREAAVILREAAVILSEAKDPASRFRRPVE
jgi:hypothetical protein